MFPPEPPIDPPAAPVEASNEAHRHSRGVPWLESIAYDMRFAVRSLRRTPGFTVTAVSMLALSIGLNLAVFTVVSTVLFRGFPLVKDNNRILYIQERYTLDSCCLLYPDFLAWREQAKSFQNLAMVGGKAISLRDGQAGTRDTFATTITANAFSLLGVRPLLGRDFVLADEAAGAPQAVILTYRAWLERYGERDDIIGHQVQINKEPATIVGVMPEGFDFPEHGLLWMPLQPTPPMLQGKPTGYLAFGRLTGGATKARAEAELDTINKRLEADFPATNKGVRARLSTFAEFSIGPDARMIYGSLWLAAWIVLVIACANLANLTLARTLGRSREFSTRVALGAGHGRLVRQIFAESLTLAVMGGAIGWWLAQSGIRAWVAATYSRYVVLDYSIGSGKLGYLAGIVVITSILFGLIPILSALRMDIHATLKGTSGKATVSLRTRRLSAALVAGQMALAVILLAGTGVLARSLWNVVGAETGVTGADKVLVGHVGIPRDDYRSAETRNAFWDRLRASLAGIPGVDSVSAATDLPVSNPGYVPFELADGPAAQKKPSVTLIAAGTGYLHAVGARLLAGREFADSDGPGTPRVALVNQSFATTFWPGQDALGQRVRLPIGKALQWYTVIGVASNIMENRPLREKFLPIVYVPYRQDPGAAVALLVRTVVPANQIAVQVRRVIETSTPGVTLEDYSTLASSFAFDRDRMDLEHAELGKHAAVAPIFAIIALLLAAVGLYAVTTHSVGQRSKEIGIRMALGSDAAHVRRMVLREGMAPVAVGWFVGMAGSFALNRALESQLVGVKPHDPVTTALSAATLVLVAAVGCWLPARRASLVDPAVVLRHD